MMLTYRNLCGASVSKAALSVAVQCGAALPPPDHSGSGSSTAVSGVKAAMQMPTGS